MKNVIISTLSISCHSNFSPTNWKSKARKDLTRILSEALPEGRSAAPGGCTCSCRRRRSTIHGRRTGGGPKGRRGPRRAGRGCGGTGRRTPATGRLAGPTRSPRRGPSPSWRDDRGERVPVGEPVEFLVAG